MTSKPSETSSALPTDRPHTWIDSSEGVSTLVDILSAEPLVAIDTESDSFHRYRERVCLIQISTPGQDFIIDPLAVSDLAALRPLTDDPGREWIMNGADYDIVCLKRDFGIRFAHIFDTVVAAQFLGYPATGLAAMLARHFGLTVSKTYQRDEWFRRPLTKDQITYALGDTRYLMPLRAILKAGLEEVGRIPWAREECEQLVTREWTREPFSPDDFWRITGAKELARREQLVLRELAVMRDRRAQEMNRPVFKVLSDAVLLATARANPQALPALTNIKGISPLMARRFGADILEAVATGLQADENSLVPPPRGERRRQDPGVNRRLDLLKTWRAGKAEALTLDPGVLSPLSCLREVARANPATLDVLLELPEVSRWRARAFGAEWLVAMKGKAGDAGPAPISPPERPD